MTSLRILTITAGCLLFVGCWGGRPGSVVLVTPGGPDVAPPPDTGIDFTDSCNPGDTLGDPRFELIEPSLFRATIVWDVPVGPGAQLPSEYFDTVQLASGADPQVAAVTHTDDREFTVRFAEWPTEGSVSFALQLPDRREWTGCTHPGMDDTYFIEVELFIDGDGGQAEHRFEERVDLGDI